MSGRAAGIAMKEREREIEREREREREREGSRELKNGVAQEYRAIDQ